MSTIKISRKKTWFKPRISSAPTDGTAAYVITWDHEAYGDFFNTTGGNITYAGAAIAGDIEIYANENNGANSRSAEFKLSATTNRSPDYAGTTAITCAWTITQEGTGCEPSLKIVCGEEIADGFLPQSGGVFTFSAITECAEIVDFALEQEPQEGFVVWTSAGTETELGITMTVSGNEHKDSGRTVTFSVSARGEDESILSAYTAWTQSKADWEITDADYITFKYNWSGETGGQDLDTFTFIQFDPDGDSPYFDGWSGVGYDGCFTIPKSATISAGTTSQNLLFDPDMALLAWAGDNRDDGAEHTFINLHALSGAAELEEDVYIYIFGGWYTFMGASGNCNIELTGWKGGEVAGQANRFSGFTFSGSTQIKAKQEVSNQCYARRRNNYTDPLSGYTFMSLMHYHVPTNTVSLYAAKNIDPYDTSIPTQYCGQYGYHRAWSVITSAFSGNTLLSAKTSNQHTEVTQGSEFNFLGESVVHLNVEPIVLYYSDNETELHETDKFIVSSCTFSYYDDGNSNNCELTGSGLTPTGGWWGDFHLKEGESGDRRQVRLYFDKIQPSEGRVPNTYNQSFNCDALYVDIIQDIP